MVIGSYFYCNPNIGFTIKCEMQGPMRLKVCLGVKHIFTNGGEMKPNDSKVHSHSGNRICAEVANVRSLSWKGKKTPNWAPMTPLQKVLKCKCSALTLFIYTWFTWVMIKKAGIKLNLLKTKVKRCLIKACYT
jgi:hypothetical protein